ncbi:hypothetical protein [Leptothrix discophora]|uniref:Uncharacterized protein n=1 Tax=Leptothrix discophora TaxID=89 RepID=A0ABT9G0S8_LEPDI|nr:hypothetical protein [Leptothrix discophora]MDP4300072.1 hypothetical protein [Leptothrix discophora]
MTAAARCRHPARPGQTGAGSLPVLLLLLLGLLLFLLHSQQALIGRTRRVALEVRGASAHEAAEAGLAWAVAHLNHPGGLDGNGRAPSEADLSDPAAALALLPARERLLNWPTPAAPLPRHDNAALACVDGEHDWICRWATSLTVAATPPSPTGSALAPADGRPHAGWTLQLQAGPASGTLTLRVAACSHASDDCGTDPAGDDFVPEARRRVSTTLTLLADVAHLPDAALAAGGLVVLGSGSRVIQGEAGQTGASVESGAEIVQATGSSVQGLPGRPAGDSVQADIAALRNPAARWWHHFHATPDLLRSLPSLRHVACPEGGCTGAHLKAAVADGSRVLWVDGSLQLDGGRWGSAERPLLLIVDGATRLRGPVEADGWLITASLDWQADALDAARARWLGAISSWGEARLDGSLDLVHRPSTLARLRGAVGTWTVLPGSWRDHGP